MKYSFSSNIKKLRKKLGFTQKQMADFANSSINTYVLFEQGDRKPQYKLIIQIMRVADLFDVTFEELAGKDMELFQEELSDNSDLDFED